MVVALTYVAVSVGVLALLTFIYVIEDIKGERVFLLTVRTKLDVLLAYVVRRIELFMFSLTNGVVRLLLHYGAHSLLKRMLAVIKKLEQKVEDLVRQNRNIAKSISTFRSSTHLSAIADHKEEVALSEAEKEKLRSH